MKLGIVADTHHDKANALEHIIAEFKKRGVEVIIHCGDITAKHLNPDLFGGLPVICALVEEQVGTEAFLTPPAGWKYTEPGDRIRHITPYVRAYIGHKRAFEFLTGSEKKLNEMLNEIRRKHDGVRYLFAGHTHHGIYKRGKLIDFINPGAVEDSLDGGYEFAVLDTDTEEIVFSRILRTTPVKAKPPFSVGVISDSLNISDMDVNFWVKLRKEFENRGVSHVIHCGNIALCDVGQPELAGFKVSYNLRTDQLRHDPNSAGRFENWKRITAEDPIVEINGYKFYVQLDLGATLLDQSEVDMHVFCLKLRQKYPETSYVLCGFTNDALYEEGEQSRIINPGDCLNDRGFAVICLPRAEITFGHVPVDPLPAIVAA
jgi:predicted phosphodiesterase